MIKTPEKHEQPYGMMGLNSSSTPSTNTNIDLHSMPVSTLSCLSPPWAARAVQAERLLAGRLSQLVPTFSLCSCTDRINCMMAQSPESLEDLHLGRDIRQLPMTSSRSMPNEMFLDQVCA